MRVIAGELRGRRFEAPPGMGTRPMLDRVREAIFSTLAPWLDGAAVLDLFAGSGAMSIEALSRGAERALLVEADPAVRRVEAANVIALGLEERADLGVGDATDPRSWAGGPWDVVFCDPPFPWLRDPARRRAVLAMVGGLLGAPLAPEGVVVLHVPEGELREGELDAAARGAGLAGVQAQERVYGGQSIWYLQPGD